MNKIKILLVVLLITTSIFAIRHKDILYTMDGSEHTGELMKITENQIVINTPDGEKTFHKDSVRSIDLGKWRPGDEWQSKRDVDDQILIDALEETALSKGLRTDYPTAGHITLYEKGTITVNEDMSGEYVQRKIVYITNERGKSEGSWVSNYFEDVQSINIDFARAIGRDRSIKTIADNAIEDGSPYNHLSEYQRLRRKKFAMTGTDIGSVIDYQVTTTFDKFDEFFSLAREWHFYDTEPILKSIFEIRYHKKAPVEYVETEMPVKADKDKEDGYRIYRWTMEDIDAYVEETMLPSTNRIMPNVAVRIPTNEERLSAAFYNKMMEAYDAEAEVKAIISEKIDGNPTVEKIYNYVSEKFSANEINMNNYYPYPKPLSKLLEMSQIARHERVFVLWAFMKAAGLEPEMVLYGPAIDAHIPDDMFNEKSFNSYHVRVDDNGKTRYLMPDEFKRYDHQAPPDGIFVLPLRAEDGELEEHDFLPKDYKYRIPKYSGKMLPDGTLSMTYNVEFHGPMGADDYRYYKYRKPKEIDNRFQEIVKEIDEMANITDYTLEGFKELADEVEISYSCEIPAYAIRAGEEVLAFKLPTVDFNAWEVGAQERTLPFSRSGNFHNEKYIEIQIPDGYEIESMPEPIDLDIGYESFKAEISMDGNVLKYHHVIEGEHERIIDPDDYPEYKEFVEEKSKFADRWVLVKRK
ncbi:MAG: DUF3857 domain-containing protein [Candidatus Zixiibacteriota bacterium]